MPQRIITGTFQQKQLFYKPSASMRSHLAYSMTAQLSRRRRSASSAVGRRSGSGRMHS